MFNPSGISSWEQDMGIIDFFQKNKKKQENNMSEINSENSSNPVFTFIALREEIVPKWHSISKILEENFSLDSEITNIEEEKDRISGYVANGVLSIALMPAPIPWADLEGPCETAWYWPDAKEQMEKHNAHLIVTVMATNLDKIDANLLLTKLISATALASNAIGIYWGSGTLVHSCETFMEFNQGISREQLPLYNWIDFRVNPEENGNYTLFSTGMKAFELMEIEIVDSESPPNVLIDKAFNIAHYLLDNGPILNDGDTIGFTESEKIKISHTASIWDKKTKVYKLNF